ncbi:MAG TPA: NUDIX hydrolase, partial [Candidatus Dormibacteraeota bacterium]|nr:NUDIX hydrolase [Candidatus Dormibacteraeota bacterium]
MTEGPEAGRRLDDPAADGDGLAAADLADARRLAASIARGRDARSTSIASGRGVPHWLASTLGHCSRCGAPLDFGPLPEEERDRLSCPSCGLVTYVNPRLVVTTFPVTGEGEVVLLRRGIEPGYGSWAQPGGFLEVDETVTEAAIRETVEETGL